MHEFAYKGNRLYCEKVSIEALAKRYGTPLYVYSQATFLGHYRKLRDAFREVDPLICYSVKANSNLSILTSLVDEGAGLDIVSGGELFRARKAGCRPGRIVYASVGKTPAEIEEAVRSGILFFNVESSPELDAIERASRKAATTARAAIRINPDVAPKTHSYITTGKLTNKFGIDLETAGRILRSRKRWPHVRVAGIHIHIGSQITESAPFVEAIRKVLSFIEQMKQEGVPIEFLNIGGGLGIVYHDEKPQTAADYAKEALPLLKKSGLRIIMEPGRFIIGSAGILVVKVLYVKETPLKRFIIIDGGMNDLIRPSLYGAFHRIVPLRKKGGKQVKADVVGPICESGDFLAKERLLPPVKEGDFLAVMSAGAYGFSMSSNYNSRTRSAEIMVAGAQTALIRQRETREDLVRQERIVRL